MCIFIIDRELKLNNRGGSTVKDFTIKNKTHWVKVTRFADKSFTFALGFSGDIRAYRKSKIGKDLKVTISEAKEHAKYILNNP